MDIENKIYTKDDVLALIERAIKDKLIITGEVNVCLRGPDGKIKEYDTFNLVVKTGRYHIADQLSDQSEGSMSHMAIGTGTTAQTENDTQLETELSRKAFSSGPTQGSGADANKVVYVGTWAAGEGTGAIAEAGIFNASSSGIMLARTTFPVKNKGASDALTLTWTVTINS